MKPLPPPFLAGMDLRRRGPGRRPTGKIAGFGVGRAMRGRRAGRRRVLGAATAGAGLLQVPPQRQLHAGAGTAAESQRLARSARPALPHILPQAGRADRARSARAGPDGAARECRNALRPRCSLAAGRLGSGAFQPNVVQAERRSRARAPAPGPARAGSRGQTIRKASLSSAPTPFSVAIQTAAAPPAPSASQNSRLSSVSNRNVPSPATEAAGAPFDATCASSSP